MNLIELVPRDISELISMARTTLKRSWIHGVNVPDIVRLPIRSDDAAIRLTDEGVIAIPHIRCMDRSLDDSVALADRLFRNGVTAMLVVSGDRPQSGEPLWDVSPVDLIPAIKSEVPGMTVYAGMDPYRSPLATELEYMRQKVAAGADGFFSQPFFDIHLASYYSEQIPNIPLFMGVSPVVSDASRRYWSQVNRVPFPANFDTSLIANAQIADQMIRFAAQRHQHVYLMPIKVDLEAYLSLVDRLLAN
ncbi:methylenetetrahydrofolate reductase [bacterium]|nr:methylenetetrahydrofolate reductase [bacterium]